MKVKHYLSKAQRKELEEILTYWDIKILQALSANDEYSLIQAQENYYLYIDYIEWCGFKIKYYRNCKFKIFK